MVAQRTLGVDAQSKGDPGGAPVGTGDVVSELVERVENDVVGQIAYPSEVGRTVGGCVGVDFEVAVGGAAGIGAAGGNFPGKGRFVYTAGTCTVKVGPNQPHHLRHGKGLQGQENFCPRPVGGLPQQRQVVLHRRPVHHVGRGRYRGGVKTDKVGAGTTLDHAREVTAGFCSVQGRP